MTVLEATYITVVKGDGTESKWVQMHQWSKKLMEGISETQIDRGRLQQDLHSLGI